MRRADHDDFEGMAVGWALHALEPDDEQEFTDHLLTCDRCQQLVRESEETLGELAYDVPLVDPPPQLLDRIRQATGATSSEVGARTQVEHSAAPAIPLRRRSVRRMPPWFMPAVAAGLVIIALLGWNVLLQNRIDESQRVAAQRQDVITKLAKSSTRAVLADSQNRTVGYVVQRGSNVEIVAAGLAPNDRVRSTYVLWAVQGSGEPARAVGAFDIVKATMDVRAVGGSPPTPDTVSGYAVSKEPGRNVPKQPSEVIATGAVLS